MKLFVHGFWNGFMEKTDSTHITFFLDLFQEVFDEGVEIARSFEEADVLLETVFSDKTYLFDKAWKYTFLFSGESRLNAHYKSYSCVLYGERNHDNIINVPLFIPNIYCCNLLDKLESSCSLTVASLPVASLPVASLQVASLNQKKSVCSVISNSAGNDRNRFIDELEKVMKVDHLGSYRSNAPRITEYYGSDEFIEKISEYKFIISMENSRGETYITEKILHGLKAGIIPIYWGSPKIFDYFNKERFIYLENSKDCSSVINQIQEIMNDDSKFREMVNKPIFSFERTLIEIAKDIKNLIFEKKYAEISRIYVINSPEFELERHNRLKSMFSTLGIKDYQVKYICPTYKHTISDETMAKYVTKDLVKRLRVKGMTKAEISLFFNYKKNLEDIEKNYSDGLFFIFESDVLYKLDKIDELSDFLKSVSEKKDKFDLIHFGEGMECLLFRSPFHDEHPYDNSGLPTSRRRIENMPDTHIEDITSDQDRYRLIRKFYTRCTDTFIWNFSGIVKFLKYFNDFPYYDVPFDYYMHNMFETDVDFKNYWSLDTFFIQGSNKGFERSTIQND